MLQAGIRGYRDSGGYEAFIKYCKKYSKALSERAILRSQQTLKNLFHIGERDHESNQNEESIHKFKVKVKMNGNGVLDEVTVSAPQVSEPEKLIDAQTLSSMLTEASKAAFIESKESMLAVGLDYGARLGYFYPTADMLYPDRFSKLDYNDDDEDEEEEDDDDDDYGDDDDNITESNLSIAR